MTNVNKGEAYFLDEIAKSKKLAKSFSQLFAVKQEKQLDQDFNPDEISQH